MSRSPGTFDPIDAQPVPSFKMPSPEETPADPSHRDTAHIPGTGAVPATANDVSEACESSAAASPSLADVIERLESDAAPCDEHHFHGPITAVGRTLRDRGELIPADLVAEEIAFLLHAHDHQNASVWGLYFGPFMTGLTDSGASWQSPPLSLITADVLARWRARAGTTPHPVMRARYADLLWEIPKKLDGVRPDAILARVAVDAYLEAVTTQRYDHEVIAIAKAKRALEISLSLCDGARVARARDTLLALEDAVADDDSLGLWGFCFDTFVEPPNRRVSLSDAHRGKLVGDLEARLTRFEAASPCQYHPAGPEAAAVRLANHYRRIGQTHDVARVLRVYGGIVRRMRGTAAALVLAHTLERLYDQFKSSGLPADADALTDLIRVTGEEMVADMKQISVTKEIPRERLEEYFSGMLAGSTGDVLVRIAVHFIPNRGELEAQLLSLAQKAPISFLMTHTIKDDDGRTVACVGPLEADLEGQLVRHISESMQFTVPWLRESIARGLERGVLSNEALLDFLFSSPLFQPKRRAMLVAGLEAFVQSDAMSAIHILVPQVEQVLRQLAIFGGVPIYTQRRGGGLHVRTLDDLLRDEDIGEALGDDVATYLRVLLTDARGWNVRNSVCHGLAPVGALTMPVADRVVHALLVLALLRHAEDVPPKDGA